jgi:uncharacterized membrane protein HdeD (DUF308 family)
VNLDTWLVYVLAAIGLSLSPGPNGLLALTHGALHGWRRTMFTIVGGALGFVAVVAFHAVLLGAILVGIGYRIRRQVEGEWVLYLTGALSLLFGVLVLLQPAAGGLSIVLMVAVWSTITGALQLVLAWRLARSERGA